MGKNRKMAMAEEMNETPEQEDAETNENQINEPEDLHGKFHHHAQGAGVAGHHGE